MARGPQGESEDLWVVLGWITRMRWALCVAVFVVACVHEVATGIAIPHRQFIVTGVVAFALNRQYAKLLRRWRPAGHETAQKLWWLACTQIGADLVLVTFVMHLTGGMSSPLWFLYMPDLLATIFLARYVVTGLFSAGALGLFALLGVIDGRWNSGAAAQVGGLGGLVTLISFYVAESFADVHQSALRSAKLRAEKEAAEALSQRKDHVLSLVSHELNNPIMALRWAIHGARKAREKGAGHLDKMFERVDSQANRLTRIVGDLYDVTSVEAGRLRVKPRHCEVMSVLEETIEPLRQMHPKMEITLDGPPHVAAHWDVERIEQLLTNLLVNAAKYAGPSARVRVVVRPSKDDALTLEVNDDGPGIPAERLTRIFEPFQRYDAGGVSRGLGLGLALARQIAELHDGEIWAESEAGRGTTFFVRLPTEANETTGCRRRSGGPSEPDDSTPLTMLGG